VAWFLSRQDSTAIVWKTWWRGSGWATHRFSDRQETTGGRGDPPEGIRPSPGAPPLLVLRRKEGQLPGGSASSRWGLEQVPPFGVDCGEQQGPIARLDHLNQRFLLSRLQAWRSGRLNLADAPFLRAGGWLQICLSLGAGRAPGQCLARGPGRWGSSVSSTFCGKSALLGC